MILKDYLTDKNTYDQDLPEILTQMMVKPCYQTYSGAGN